MKLIGRLTQASNATFQVELDGRLYVYKPLQGERPLWDFPDGTLGHREVATYLLSEELGWRVVPQTTWVEDGAFGPGMIQEWIETAGSPVGVFSPDDVPGQWRPVLNGTDQVGREVIVAHRSDPQTLRMALFDVVVNNADRKGSHLLETDTGHLYGVDHGLTLHTEPKLRTVLWGFAGEPAPSDLRADLSDLLDRWETATLRVRALVTSSELVALRERVERLLTVGRFPEPDPRVSVIPWPPL